MFRAPAKKIKGYWPSSKDPFLEKSKRSPSIPRYVFSRKVHNALITRSYMHEKKTVSNNATDDKKNSNIGDGCVSNEEWSDLDEEECSEDDGEGSFGSVEKMRDADTSNWVDSIEPLVAVPSLMIDEPYSGASDFFERCCPVASSTFHCQESEGVSKSFQNCPPITLLQPLVTKDLPNLPEVTFVQELDEEEETFQDIENRIKNTDFSEAIEPLPISRILFSEDSDSAIRHFDQTEKNATNTKRGVEQSVNIEDKLEGPLCTSNINITQGDRTKHGNSIQLSSASNRLQRVSIQKSLQNKSFSESDSQVQDYPQTEGSSKRKKQFHNIKKTAQKKSAISSKLATTIVSSPKSKKNDPENCIEKQIPKRKIQKEKPSICPLSSGERYSYRPVKRLPCIEIEGAEIDDLFYFTRFMAPGYDV